MTKEIYKKAAEKYKPERTETLFIAESPPVQREGEELRYFYFDNIQKGDILLKSTMKALFPEEYEQHKNNKPNLLNPFKIRFLMH